MPMHKNRLFRSLSDTLLALMVEGLENSQIARRLAVSPFTIKSHVSNILLKLSVASRTEAVTLALRNHIVL